MIIKITTFLIIVFLIRKLLQASARAEQATLLKKKSTQKDEAIEAEFKVIQ